MICKTGNEAPTLTSNRFLNLCLSAFTCGLFLRLGRRHVARFEIQIVGRVSEVMLV